MWSDIPLWLWFAFPWSLATLDTFHVSIGHLYVFGKLPIQTLRPFFNWDCCVCVCVCVFCYWVVWIPYIFWILNSYQICLTNIFSHSIGCLFILLFPLHFRSFLAWGSPVCLFLLLLPVLWVPVLSYLKKKKNYKINVKELFSHVLF